MHGLLVSNHVLGVVVSVLKVWSLSTRLYMPSLPNAADSGHCVHHPPTSHKHMLSCVNHKTVGDAHRDSNMYGCQQEYYGGDGNSRTERMGRAKCVHPSTHVFICAGVQSAAA